MHLFVNVMIRFFSFCIFIKIYLFSYKIYIFFAVFIFQFILFLAVLGLCMTFFSLRQAGASLGSSVSASYCSGLSCCGAQALATGASVIAQ